MKFCFISKNQNLSIGSYRIHVNDLYQYFTENGVKSEINPTNINDYDVHIYGKKNYDIVNKNKINGIITPASDFKNLNKFDFAIVGSIEEKESIIGKIKYIFIFPQIEKMYLNTIPKTHIPKKEIIIGYHGNHLHLNHMELGLNKALERISEKFPIKLVYICSDSNGWIQGIPNVKKEFIKWDINTIKSDILNFDIGIIPNISDFCDNKDSDENIMVGKYNTDITIRFKNKSNIGRLLVLAQCGIPIVADITPSNMHILGNSDNGFAVLNEDGWYDAIYKLCNDHNVRNFVSQNAYNEVKRLYDPYIHAKNLYDNINKIKK